MDKQEALRLPTMGTESASYEEILAQADEAYESMGVSDLYSTGIAGLDRYMSGGFGRRGSYEMVVISSAPKKFKTTVAMRMMVENLKNKVPMLWFLEEMSYAETLNTIRGFFYPNIHEADKLFEQAIGKSLFILKKETIKNIQTIEQAQALIELWRANKNIELVYIDPFNYLTADASQGDQRQNNINDFNMLRKLQAFLEKNKMTALLVAHNTKDSTKHRQEGLAGSAYIARMATKIIETRTEGRVILTDDAGIEHTHLLLSFEMWSARGVNSWEFMPYVLDVEFNPSHKGVKIQELPDSVLCAAAHLLHPDAIDRKQRELYPPLRKAFEDLAECSSD